MAVWEIAEPLSGELIFLNLEADALGVSGPFDLTSCSSFLFLAKLERAMMGRFSSAC